MSDYFFELLTEEIPAWMLDSALSALRASLAKVVAQTGAAESSVTIDVNATSRRIAFFLGNLPEKQADHADTVKGPPKKAAYDASGNPTQALHGFLRKNNATLDDVADGGDYVLLNRNVAGRATADILQELIPQTIESIRWPKMMRWSTGESSYIRPIHSVVSLLSQDGIGTYLPIALFGVASGTTTVGHRTLAPKRFEVKSYGEYLRDLELARVIVDPQRRKQAMAAAALACAKEVDGAPSDDPSIWSQWQYLTEYPGVVRAEFRREYLALPEEVLVTVMRVHQKQLPIRDAHGRLTNSFLAVLDNEGDPEKNAAYGNSFVTNARFADAQFFYATDRRRKLEERVEQLSHLQFQEKLGDYRAKTERIVAIAKGICETIGLDAADALTAAGLCKTDLVTEMVKEFTDLQGRIGGIYAREEGLADNVWQAIYDHYMPVSLEDELPRTITGAIVSLADRIDTLAGFFAIGAKPSGSKDPFALRRAAQGVVQILLNRDKREVKIGIDRLIDLGIAAQQRATTPALKADLLAFFAERVRTILEASAWKFAYDEVAAAMEAGWASSLTDLVDRVQAVKTMRDEPGFLSILDSAKRIANITAGHDATRVDPSRLEHDTERRLAELADVVTGQIDELVTERQYRSALESFAAMAPELETFFKDVMVMVDDESVRRNRMSLLRKVGGAVMKIADVTKIVVDRRDYRP
ncbi:MAG: glycine--tRNA ligase subunit beta [Acidobacteria bacterium]|nr:glycine--tRNA ligase subunit beta [Acidobacteriota bacterium]MBV9477211.1 glycine--tRNA ligase subunit beta [Acidobacteriota bacterium]